jgi:hypothetical protein
VGKKRSELCGKAHYIESGHEFLSGSSKSVFVVGCKVCAKNDLRGPGPDINGDAKFHKFVRGLCDGVLLAQVCGMMANDGKMWTTD